MDHDHPRTPVSSPEQHAQPTPTKERFSSIDTLRGFALMGILVPNIWHFAWPMSDITGHGLMSDAPANDLARDITFTLFLGKFMFIFAMLFGSGVIMYSRKFDRADEQGKFHSPLFADWSLWYTRCFVLLCFGMIHAYLFWYGDILTLYAMAGLTLLWWVRRLNPMLLLWGGLGVFLAWAALMIGFTLFGYWSYTQGNTPLESLTGGDPHLQRAGYTGTFIDAFKTRFFTTLTLQIFFGILLMPVLWGIMCMGMGLTRMNILTGQRSRRFYFTAAAIFLPAGLLLTMLLYTASQRRFGDMSAFVWQSGAQSVGVPLAFGYVALVIGLSKCAWAGVITVPLAAVGRMALTNYFTHTLLCTTFFYGYGLGYFAQIEYPRLWLVVLGVWAINIIFSLLWLRVFSMGPFEWLWRCLTYRRLVPIR